MERTQTETFLDQLVTIDEVTKTVREWCDERKIKYRTVYERRAKFYTWGEALNPVNLGKQNRTKLRNMNYNRRMNKEAGGKIKHNKQLREDEKTRIFRKNENER